MSQMTNYLENKIVDDLFRAQAPSWPASLHVGLFTAAPNDAGGGTEVSGGSYGRAAVARSLANWAGTQSAGSTTASSGTGGQTSNNVAIVFPAPTASWGSIVAFGIFDAASGGNLLLYGNLTIAKTVNNGDAAPQFNAASLTVTFA